MAFLPRAVGSLLSACPAHASAGNPLYVSIERQAPEGASAVRMLDRGRFGLPVSLPLSR